MVNISNFKFYVHDFSLEFQFQSFLEEIFQVGQQQNGTNVFRQAQLIIVLFQNY